MNDSDFFEVVKKFKYTPTYLDKGDFVAIEPKSFIKVKSKFKERVLPNVIPQSNESKPIKIIMNVDSLEKYLFNRSSYKKEKRKEQERTVVYSKCQANEKTFTEKELKRHIKELDDQLPRQKATTQVKANHYKDFSEGTEKNYCLTYADALGAKRPWHGNAFGRSFNKRMEEMKFFRNTLSRYFNGLNVKESETWRQSNIQGSSHAKTARNDQSAVEQIHEFKNRAWLEKQNMRKTFRQRCFLPAFKLVDKDNTLISPTCLVSEMCFDYNFKPAKNNAFAHMEK